MFRLQHFMGAAEGKGTESKPEIHQAFDESGLARGFVVGYGQNWKFGRALSQLRDAHTATRGGAVIGLQELVRETITHKKSA